MMGFFYFFPDCFFSSDCEWENREGDKKAKNIKIIASRKRLVILRVYSNTIIYFFHKSGHQATERKLL